MTEREKQIEAVEQSVKWMLNNPKAVTPEMCAENIIDTTLAPWLKEGPYDGYDFTKHLADIQKRLIELETVTRNAYTPNAVPIKAQSLPPKPEFTVRIMRKNGSKWHVVSIEPDYGMATGCADRWFADHEISAVEVIDPPDETVYLKRKP